MELAAKAFEEWSAPRNRAPSSAPPETSFPSMVLSSLRTPEAGLKTVVAFSVGMFLNALRQAAARGEIARRASPPRARLLASLTMGLFVTAKCSANAGSTSTSASRDWARRRQTTDGVVESPTPMSISEATYVG